MEEKQTPTEENQPSQESSQEPLKETSTVYKILGRSIPSTKFLIYFFNNSEFLQKCRFIPS
jgi:hypothetical protein